MLIPTAAQLFSTLAWLFAAMQASINSQYATLLPAIEGVTSTVSSLVTMPLYPFKISTVKTLLAHPTNRSSWSFPSISSKVKVDISEGLLSVKFTFPIVRSPFVPVSNATQLDATRLVDATTNSSLDGARSFETCAEVITSDALFWSLAQDTCAQDDVVDVATSNADKGALSTAFANGKTIAADILFGSLFEPTQAQCDVDEVPPKDLESPELGIHDHNRKTIPEPEEASAQEMPPKMHGSSSANTNEPSSSDLCPVVESCEVVVWSPPEPLPSDYSTAVNQAWYTFWTLVGGLIPILFTVIGVVFLLEAYYIGAVFLRWLSSVLSDAVFALTIRGLQFVQSVVKSDEGIVDVFDVNVEYELEEVEDVSIIVEEDIQITVAPIPLPRLISIIPVEDMLVDGDGEVNVDGTVDVERESGLQSASAPVVEEGPKTDADTVPPPDKGVRKRKQKTSQPMRSQVGEDACNKKGGKRKAKAKRLVESVPLLCDGEVVLPLVDTDDGAACHSIPEPPVSAAANPTAITSTHRLPFKGKNKKRTGRKRNVIIPHAATSTVSHAGSARATSCPSLEVTMAGLRSNTLAYTQTNTGGRERMKRMSRAAARAPSTSMDANVLKMEWDEEGWEEVKGRKHRSQKRDAIEDDEYGVEEDEFEEENLGFEHDYDDAFGTSLPASL